MHPSASSFNSKTSSKPDGTFRHGQAGAFSVVNHAPGSLQQQSNAIKVVGVLLLPDTVQEDSDFVFLG